MTPDEKTTYDLRMLAYFWRDKEDLERLIGHEEILAAHPTIAAAWSTYKTAKRTLALVIDAELSEAEARADPE